jgi:signal transduction histidine kinase/CheY-like chemotaxis protein
MNDSIQVLLVEDDPGFARLIVEFLTRNRNAYLIPNLEITTTGLLKEALDSLSQKQFDVALIDLSLPDSIGLETFRKIQEAAANVALIVLSGNDDDRLAVQALQEGAQDYIAKGRADEDFLKRSIRYALERKQAEENIQKHNRRLKALREIDIAILSADSIEKTIYAALGHMRELLNCRRATMTIVDREANEALLFDVTMSQPTSLPKGTRIPIALFEEMREVLSDNQPLVIDDLSVSETLPLQFQALVTNEGYRSLCVLPLFSRGHLIGTLSLSSDVPDFFNADVINLGREIANQVAIAISQNSLLEDLRKLNASLEERVAQRTEELTQTNMKLDHANRAKDEFMATMTHELRTPLTSIIGLSESLLEQRRDPLTELQQRSLKIIESSGQHLLELINDVLDLSKIEAGQLDYYPQVVDVNTLCRSSLAFVKEQAVRKSLKLAYEDDKTSPRIHADPRRLKQALVNLLSNAVKFTPEHGTVSLEVNTDIEDDLVQFSVIDTGVGIAEEDLQRLFQPFAQVDSSFNRQFEGTGLGLVLIKRLTDLHGGSVHVESEPGRGSRFTINVPWGRLLVAQQEVIETGGEPVAGKETQKPSASLDKSTEKGMVLLAEDNAASTLTVSEYLESHGYRIVNAHDGEEAVEKALEANPDIILMDIQMPVMDGLEAIRRLRADSRFDSTPIIALTALAMPGDRKLCLEAGANEYMSKPVSLKKLVKTISKMLERNA